MMPKKLKKIRWKIKMKLTANGNDHFKVLTEADPSQMSLYLKLIQHEMTVKAKEYLKFEFAG